jgi:hypothetical protein
MADEYGRDNNDVDADAAGEVTERASFETALLPDEVQDAWERCKAADLSPRVLRTLFRVGCGETFREAAANEGYVNHAHIWRVARQHGLYRPQRERILDGCRRVAHLANDEIERRLVEDTDNVSTRDAIVAGGVAIDKLSRAEHWDRTGPEQDYAGAMREMAEAMKGQTVKLELTVEPRPEPVDVTPGEQGPVQPRAGGDEPA